MLRKFSTYLTVALTPLIAMASTSSNALAEVSNAPVVPAAPPVSNASLQELQRQLDVLGQEVQKLKIGDASNEPVADRGQLGYGPGVSKVYRTQQGFSIGGYAEVLMENFLGGYDAPGRRVSPGMGFSLNDGQHRIDMTRAVIYLGYKFDDTWVLNSEFEFEHAGDEISVEFLYLDHFMKPWLNVRFGKLLMPVGLTNEIHEPPTFLGSHRPLVETLIIPTTWAEYGVGIYGDAGPLTYRSYLVTGLNASGFAADVGVREGRHEAGFANASNVASVTRIDYTATPGLLAGGSIYLGSATTTPASGFDRISVPARMFEAHAQYHLLGFDLSALGAYSIFDNIDALDSRKGLGLDSSIGSRQLGAYFQVGYDLLRGGAQTLTPFLRYEYLDTQYEVPPGYTRNGANLIRECVLGINYKPHSQIVLKADYQWYSLGDGLGVNQWNLAMGYVF